MTTDPSEFNMRVSREGWITPNVDVCTCGPTGEPHEPEPIGRVDLRQHDAEVAAKALEAAAADSDRRVLGAPFSAASLGPWLRDRAARNRAGEQS